MEVIRKREGGVEDAAGLGIPLLPGFQCLIYKVELWPLLTRLLQVLGDQAPQPGG